MIDYILLTNTILLIFIVYINLWRNTMTDNKKPQHNNNQSNEKQQQRIDEVKRDYNKVANIPVAPTKETGEIPDCDD